MGSMRIGDGRTRTARRRTSTGNTWGSSLCPDAKTCSENSVVSMVRCTLCRWMLMAANTAMQLPRWVKMYEIFCGRIDFLTFDLAKVFCVFFGQHVVFIC